MEIMLVHKISGCRQFMLYLWLFCYGATLSLKMHLHIDYNSDVSLMLYTMYNKYHAGWHGTCFVVLFSLKRLDQPKRTPTVSFYCRWPCYEKQKIPKIHQNIRNICINRRKKKLSSVHIKFHNHYKIVTAVGKKNTNGKLHKWLPHTKFKITPKL